MRPESTPDLIWVFVRCPACGGSCRRADELSGLITPAEAEMLDDERCHTCWKTPGRIRVAKSKNLRPPA